MPKDDSRGARTGRNVRLTVMISEEAKALLEAEIAARSQGVRKPGHSELVDEAVLRHFQNRAKSHR